MLTAFTVGSAGLALIRRVAPTLHFPGSPLADTIRRRRIARTHVGHVACEEEGIPIAMHRRGRILFAYGLLCAGMPLLTGCVSMRRDAPSADLQPCADGFAYTEDGWRLGVRHYRASNPDPGKLPVVLCHGLGLNGTFWTITDNHLASQLADRGYDVFVFDIRGSGENAQVRAPRSHQQDHAPHVPA